MNTPHTIAVFGSSQPQPGSEGYEEARSLGGALACAGWTVLTGGYRGVMEAASRGAREAGGRTVGVITASFSERGLRSNEFVDEVIEVPTYADRLVRLITLAEGYVILRGGSGTLSELFLSWELVKNRSLPPRPIVLLGVRWKRVIDFLTGEFYDELSFSSHLNLLAFARDADEAVTLINRALKPR